MTASEQYKALATEFRSKARNEQSPTFRAELEELAKCYEWAAKEVSHCSASDIRPISLGVASNDI
jgi:hypothetical protein